METAAIILMASLSICAIAATAYFTVRGITKGIENIYYKYEYDKVKLEKHNIQNRVLEEKRKHKKTYERLLKEQKAHDALFYEINEFIDDDKTMEGLVDSVEKRVKDPRIGICMKRPQYVE